MNSENQSDISPSKHGFLVRASQSCSVIEICVVYLTSTYVLGCVTQVWDLGVDVWPSSTSDFPKTLLREMSLIIR